MKSTTKKTKAAPKKPVTGRRKPATSRIAPRRIAKTSTDKAGLDTPAEASAITQPKSPSQPQPKSNPPKSRGIALLLWTSGLAITIGTGFATWPFWSPYLIPHQAVSKSVSNQPNVAKRLSDVEKIAANNAKSGNVIQDLLNEKNLVKGRLDKLMVEVNSLDAALKSVRQMVEATTPPSSQAAKANKSLQKLSDRFTKIEKSNETLGNILQRMDRLEKNMPVAQDQPTIIDKGLSQAIDAISQRVGSLETASVGNTSSGGSALMLAVSQLQEILHGSGTFSSQLAALVELAGNDSEIAGSLNNIKPYASSGITSLNLLRSRFHDVSLSMSQLAPAPSANGWLDRVKNRLSSLISLRRIDSETDALIRKTEKLLNDGDLSGAVDAIAGYSNASAKVEAWIKAAHERLAAESAIAALHVFALSLVAQRENQSQ